MPEYTKEQQRVIAHREGNLLVSAAAGSGKTAVLVERIFSLVKEGADIASFLVVTFTRAAADELRQRLLSRLESAAEEDEAMRTQVQRLELASISTIHAFCLQLLSRYFEKAGIEPNLRTCSEAERIIFQMRAMDTVLDEAYADEGMLARLEQMGSSEQVRLNVESLYKFLMCQPDPQGWLAHAVQEYERGAEDLENTAWFQRAQALNARGLRRAVKLAREALRFAECSASEDCGKMAGFIAGELAAIEEAVRGEAQKVSFATWRSPNKRKADDSEALIHLKELRDEYKEIASEALEQRLRADGWEAEKVERMTDAVKALAEVTRAFMDEYARIKADVGVVDYNDLEQMTLKMTQDQGVCEDLRLKYRYIFVDEYQDSSAVQEEILGRINRGDNVFHVGDVKQSIYGFRQSDPSLFLRQQREYAAGQGGELIALNRNFRSLPNVLHCTNRVFSRCMTSESAGMEYDEAARLYPGRQSEVPDPPTLIQLIDKKGAGEEEDEAPVRSEVEAVAGLIKRLVGMPIHDRDGGMRPARYGDIVVLRRAVTSALPQYMECFQQRGIPVYAGKGGSFYETLEIRQAMDYLWAVHNPLEDVHLLGAMRGVGKFTAQEMARIRLKGRGENEEGAGKRMWTCLIAYRNHPDDEALGQKTKEFMDKLHRMRRIAREESIAVLCAAVLEQTGILDQCAALPRGRVRVANLRSLPVRAAEYDAAGLRLGDFLRRIASTASRNREEDVPAFSENEDVVRIMTVHQSKGLEFPIVIGAGLGARFRISNDKDAQGYLTSRVWCEKESGLALEFCDPESAAIDSTVMTRALAAIKRQESIAEEMRILYVLMTRARERLALVGEVNGLEKHMKAWAQGGVEAACPLDWIMPAALTHPDAAVLRQKYGIALPVEGDESRWEISVMMESEAEEETPKPSLEDLEAAAEAGSALLQQLRFVYPHPVPTVQQKQSVTELAHGDEENFFVRKRPAFLSSGKKLTGSERGSAIHRFMEIVDFGALGEDAAPALRAQAEEAVRTARMTQEQADAVLDGMGEIERFLDSSIGRAIRGGAPVLREKPFEIRMDEEGQMRLVQGVIDLIVLERDGAVLVDYKTDHAGLDEQSVLERHGAQVRLYRHAAELAGLKVKKSVVYLFFTGGMVEIE